MIWGKSHTSKYPWHSISHTEGVEEKLYPKRLVLSPINVAIYFFLGLNRS